MDREITPSGGRASYTGAMITVTNLWKAFGQQDLFAGADLYVGARERVALVGPNGSGKTTLFEMLSGGEMPDRGDIQVIKQAVVGYLRQEHDPMEGRTLLEEVLSAAPGVTEAGRKLAVLEAELADSPQGDERDRLIAEYSDMHERFADLNGYTIEYDAKAILGGLGFGDRDCEAEAASFSGGEVVRAALAKLLLAAPDLLLLDEPTNHLDAESVNWLEQHLQQYKGTVIAVTHDRELINGIATRVVEVEGGRLISYKGNYEAFLEQRALVAEQAQAAERNRARQAAQAQEFIDRFRAKATKARQVQSRIKTMEKMGGPEPQKRARKSMGLAFPVPPRSGRVVVELVDVRFGYGDVPLYQGLNLAVERAQKVALVGPNGAGKTTLLKLLAGVNQVQGGQRLVGHNAKLAYFAQHQDDTLTPTNKVLDEVTAAIPAGSALRPGDLLGRFLFSGDDMRKLVSVLSGGERSRLAIAKLLVTPLNALFLDEPTNHLDIDSRDVLEAALLDYQGALVLITHDRHLIRTVATSIVEVREGQVTTFHGDYDFYLSQREGQLSESRPSKAAVKAAVKTAVKEAQPTALKPEAGKQAEERRRASAQGREAVRDLRRSLGRIEKDLAALSAEIAQLSERLADPAVYSSGADVAELVSDYEVKTRRLSQLEAAWEEAAGLLEAEGASV
ncbi:MAG: ABC-F family ATP-binding cassette domain-containing protein [Actinomycetota bacterium]